jgi:hypothetical protein
MNKVSNGWSDKPEMQPRPFKYCPNCSRPLAGGETRCQTCAQTEKGVTPDAVQKPFELPSPRPELEGGKEK